MDYSFTPPDRRMDESPFYLPDLNDISEEVGDILFMVDTSGSMSNREVWDAYSEIKGAMDQFEGKLSGWIGFFDGGIIEPKPFSSVHDLSNIHPVGGGGTDFGIIFKYVKAHMKEKRPLCIIILTDGYAPYPPESAADGIPVLWVINNEISRPPWGKVARIK